MTGDNFETAVKRLKTYIRNRYIGDSRMSSEPIEGMNVNERLWYFKLFEKFDSAAKDRDEPKLIEILKEAKFSEWQATETARVLLADPRKYGY